MSKKDNPPNLTIVPKPLEGLKNRDAIKAEQSIKAPSDNLPDGFFFGEKGLYYQDPQNEDAPAVWICSRLEVIALTKDEHHNNFGKMLEFTDEAGHFKRWIMPKALLSGRSEALQSELLKRGLFVIETPKAKSLLVRYINRSKDLPILTTVDRVGWWNDEIYILPDKVIGKPDEAIYYSEIPNQSDYSQKGTLEQWQQKIARYAVNNPRMMLFMCAAFAAPLLRLAGVEGGGFHIYGDSSTGKTTISYAAASVWGNAEERKLRWRATDNGIEKPAFDHNDSLLWLDEIGEFEPKKLSKAIYMLSNGQAKQRATDTNLKRWRLLFISTGELSSKSVVQSVDEQLKAGQEVRFMNFAADTGAYGVFNTLYPEFATAREQAEAIERAATKECYGLAGKAFIKHLINDIPKAKAFISAAMQTFIDQEVPKDAHAHIYRSAKRYAILAAAGELAATYGITGWQDMQAYNGIAAMFKEWKAEQGHLNISMEIKAAIRRVRSFIAEHGDSRFKQLERADDTHAPSTPYMVGYVGRPPGLGKKPMPDDPEEKYYYFLLDKFQSEVCKGMDVHLVTKALAMFNLIHSSPNGKDKNGNPKRTFRHKLTYLGEKHGNPITYAIPASILSFDI